MDDHALLGFLRAQRWAIQATSSASHRPQAAIIRYVVTDRLELVFDTLAGSRKVANLRANPHVALVIGGWQDSSPRSLQIEGVADFPVGEDLGRLRHAYCSAFPDGSLRESLPDITYVRVVPHWVRLSDYASEPPSILERRLHPA
jgi:general stress protein 26